MIFGSLKTLKAGQQTTKHEASTPRIAFGRPKINSLRWTLMSWLPRVCESGMGSKEEGSQNSDILERENSRCKHGVGTEIAILGEIDA